jgi:UDP-N-acetylglucosamine transferase subunit ALG13
MKSTFIPILRMAIFLFFSKVVTAPTAQPAVPTIEEALVAIKDVLAAWTGYEKCDIIFRLITGIWAFLVWWYSVALNKLVEIETSLASAAASQVKIAASQEKIADSQEEIAASLVEIQNSTASAAASQVKIAASQEEIAASLVEIQNSTASAAASQVEIAASQEKIADSQEMIAIALKNLVDIKMAEASATGADTSNTADENENIQHECP